MPFNDEPGKTGERRYAWATVAAVAGNLLAYLGLIAYGLTSSNANWTYIFGALVALSIANRIALSRINRRWSEFRQTSAEAGKAVSEMGTSTD